MRKRLFKSISILLTAAMIFGSPVDVLAAQDETSLLEDATGEELVEVIEEPVEAPVEEPVETPEAAPESEDSEQLPIESEKPEDNSKEESEIIEYAPVIEEDLSDINEEDVSESISDNELENYVIGEYSIYEAGINDFPASYQAGLTKVWKAHPNWKFERQNINLNWDKIVNSELEADRSVIWYTAPEEYRRNKWSGNWYYASKAGVEHYLDPRNFLNENEIFMFEKLSYDGSYQKETLVQKLCNETFMSGKVLGISDTYAEKLTEIGKKVGISPLHLASRIKQELGSNNGKTEDKIPIISGKYSGYEGYYNYYNIQATGTGDAAIKAGLKYASTSGDFSRPWNSREKALKGGAEFIYSGYIKRGQDTVYYEKWNVVSSPYYIHQYMQNIQAPSTESASMAKAYKSAGALSNDFVFKIPVYNNMPNASDTDKTSDKEIPLVPLKGLKFAESSVTLKSGHNIKLALNTVPANVTPEPLIYWSSDTPEVATVDGDGNITARAAGSAVVTAKSAADETITASCVINVEGHKLRFLSLDGQTVLKEYSNVYAGKTIADYPYSETEVFPESKILENKADNQELSGFYTGLNRTGVRVTEDTEILGDIDIYPYLIDIDKGFEVKPVGDFYYTGNAIKPEVEVYNKDILLKKGKDYTLSYLDNKSANADINGKILAGAQTRPTIVVKGKGNYSGSESIAFNIRQVDIAQVDVDDIILAYKESVKPQYGKPAVYLGSKKLSLDKDYILEYPMENGNLNGGSENFGAYIAAGIYPVTITGIGSVAGSKTVYEIITRKISVSKIKTTCNSLEYIGRQIEIKDLNFAATYNSTPLTMFNDTTMEEASDKWDYRLVLPKDMKTPGTKTIKLIGNKRKGFYGTKRVSVTIKAPKIKTPLSQAPGQSGSIKVVDKSGMDFTYTYVKGGVKPEISVLLEDGSELVAGVDYTVSYKNYNSAKMANYEKAPTILIKGKGVYTETVEKKYSILPKDISGLSVMFSDPEYADKPGKAFATVSVFDENGSLLKQGADYDKNIVYKNAETGAIISKTDIVDAGTRISVSVNGINNYKGSVGGEYIIKRANISKTKVLASPQVFTGRAVTISTNDLQVLSAEGSIISKDDYEILPYSYSKNINKGTASVYIRGKGNYGGTKLVKFKITALPIVWYYNK